MERKKMPKPIRRINQSSEIGEDAQSESFFIGVVDGKVKKIPNNTQPYLEPLAPMNIYIRNADDDEFVAKESLLDEDDEDASQSGRQE